MIRRLLLVSPHFPPVNAPDHQRVRALLPYLAELGWEAEVLCVDAAQVEGPQDELLAQTLPAGLRVHRCGAIPLRLARALRCGQIGYRAYFHLRAAGDRLLRTGRFDLVFFSTAIFETLVLGPHWKRRSAIMRVCREERSSTAATRQAVKMAAHTLQLERINTWLLSSSTRRDRTE